MRKNSVRKWLHAILDLLPLFVIPIFAIYTRNENYNSNIEINIEENLRLDNFNQLIEPQRISTNTSISTYTYDEDTNTYTIVNNVSADPWTSGLRINFSLMEGHVYALLFESDTTLQLYTELSGRLLTDTYETQRGLIYTQGSYQTAGIVGTRQQTGTYQIKNLMLIDLTQIFGSGNEPSNYAQYYSYFKNTYYEFSLNKSILIEGYTQTYNDTDVGSQFVYTLYNATDKYFNCTNLFNLEQVWNWIQLNLFGGNAPLMVYVVWQVIVYEFFMDLIFLLYSVFMFIIDFAENCLERPFDKIRRL